MYNSVGSVLEQDTMPIPLWYDGFLLLVQSCKVGKMLICQWTIWKRKEIMYMMKVVLGTYQIQWH